ncbi:hypothetical protein SLH46_00800 [Draconibacterium sp. IB214405]|uniref:hypothetical protein n=1 Tax=Draconibacterium sp. IB214405 TaxID=3097352 RepID=UPI002A0F3ADD|nr:hypothetical protein [Draconibacterium sp. IB214405]MDX8337698.1 hypothetical protein [Draconibacterium sp. IB214405]
MKTTVKQLTTATFIALFLIAIGVQAQGTTTKHSVYKATETSLQLEEWMTDETVWNTSDMEFFALETETTPEVEAWMTDNKIWEVNSDFCNEQESAMKVENWMTDLETWDVHETHAHHELHAWMSVRKHWK